MAEPLQLLDMPAEIVAQALVDAGLADDPAGTGTAFGWPAYVFGEPDVPDACITVYDTQGIRFGRSQPEGDTLEHFGVTIRVRGATPRQAADKAHALCNGMDRQIIRRSVLVNGQTYMLWSINRAGRPVPVGKETPPTMRKVYNINATAAIDRTA